MTNELLDAIEEGNVELIKSTFDSIMAVKIQENVETIKEGIRKDLFQGKAE